VKKIFRLFFWGLWMQTVVQAQNPETYFTTLPTLSPDAQIVIFTFEGDLWKVAAEGGLASRLTSMQGNEVRARVSPDGKWLAFSNDQMGNQDVYVMPLAGGAIKQLTFHEAYDQVDSWSWDSKFIYFTSDRYNRSSGFKVSVEGGSPVRLFGNFFNTVHSVYEHPGTGELFFNETWESRSEYDRKRYKGAYNPDIQSFNLKTNEFKVYTDYLGKDLWVSIDRNGKIYFASDELNNEYNLYTFEGNTKKNLTQFSTAIKFPFVSANGEKVVFERDYQLYIYDTKSQSSKKIPIIMPVNNNLQREQNFEVKGNIEEFDVSPDGKKMAFVSRGQLFVSDIKGKFVQMLATGNRTRVLEVKWLADNRNLVFTQTNPQGYANLFTISADGKTPARQLSNEAQNQRNLSLNKARTMAVYLSGRNEVRTLDLKSWQSKMIVKEELWGFYNPIPYFSPNDEYVMFCAYRNFETDIFLHHLKDSKTINLTQTGVTETSPVWSPDGKYIYFISNRFRPSYPRGNADNRVYRLALSKLDSEFKTDKFAELFKEEPKEEKKDDKDKGKDKKNEKTAEKKPEEKKSEPLKIEWEDWMSRLELVSPNFGGQGQVRVFQKDQKTWVVFSSNHDKNQFNLWKTTYEPFESPKTEKIEGANTFGVDIAEVDGKYYTLIDGNLFSLNLEGNKTEAISINYTFRKKLADEFNQMFYETWANVEENFYNEDFHNTDWKGMRDRYAAFLPHLHSRANLRLLLNEMLGELNASHLGFSSFGKEEETFYQSTTLATGIMFDSENPYQVTHIVKNGPADKSDKNIQIGDILTHVNGEAVNPQIAREYYFAKPSLDNEVSLTFLRKGNSFTVKIHPRNYFEINDLRYNEWIADNQKRVDEKSKKRIAYAYMKNMGEGELNRFLIEMNSEAYQRDALILDLRYNTGGNVHDDVLRFLSQRPYLKWKYREGEFTMQSNFGPASKPLVLLINEQSLSDAEMTAQGFKELKLGKIIGTETYRWIIFTSGKGLVDGSFYRLPAWGCYTLDGRNLEKEGVKPDISIKNTFKDRLEGKDPQLDRAIEEIMKELK
jgi:tricorn protease